MSENQPVVVIIDDDPDIRNALQGLLETIDLPTALFATASEFLGSRRPQRPCCIVVDVRLPGLSGLDFQQELAREHIPIPVIFITGHGDIPMSVRAMKAGAVEFLTNPLHDQDLLDAIQAALRRDRAQFEDQRKIADLRTLHESLTAREREVMSLVAAGLSNPEIAEHLVVSPATAKAHVSRAMVKLHAHHRAQLVTLAYETGLVLPGNAAAARFGGVATSSAAA
jgi:RNA polymerase sigma factor (sigma-70 family)